MSNERHEWWKQYQAAGIARGLTEVQAGKEADARVAGFVPIRFADGARLLVHVSAIKAA